jgi:hypothetical protein
VLRTNRPAGKYLSIVPTGTSWVRFKATGEKISWTKVTTVVNNIIIGKLWIDQVRAQQISSLHHDCGTPCSPEACSKTSTFPCDFPFPKSVAAIVNSSSASMMKVSTSLLIISLFTAAALDSSVAGCE